MSKEGMSLAVIKAETAVVRGAMGEMIPKLKTVLPAHIEPERFNQILLHSITQNPYLLECNRASLYISALSAATLGLVCDGILGEAYLVPFGGQVQLIPGYRGLIKLAKQSGEVKTIEARVVCENDVFSYSFGTSPTLDHVPAKGERGPITHFWAMARLTNGENVVEVMSKAQVDKIRDDAAKTRRGNAGPAWKNHYSEQGRKTVVRRLSKYLTLSVEAKPFHQAVAVEQNYEGGNASYVDKAGVTVVEMDPDPEPEDGKSDLDRFAEAAEPEAPEAEPTPPTETINPETGEYMDVDPDREEIPH